MPPKKKEDEAESLSREEKLEQLFDVARKKYGKEAVVYARDFKFKETPRISTGIFPLDYALGGGVPVGRITMFFGNKSSSKTTCILRTIGNAQRLCSACWTTIRTIPPKKEGEHPGLSCQCGEKRKTVIAWLDVEGVWDDTWARRFCNVDDIILSQPDTAEQTIDLADTYLRSGAVDIIVIDSIAFMTAMAEIERSAAEVVVGTQARLVGVQMRKFVSGINQIASQEGRRPTIIFTNQIRMRVGLVFGNPETIPGGLAQGFATSCEIHCYGGKYTMDDVSGKPISAEFRCKVEKNKTGPAKMEAEYKMVLSKTEVKDIGEVIDEGWAIQMGENAGLVESSGTMVTWKGERFRGRSQLEKYWALNKDKYDDFKNELMPLLLSL
jgi:recombination protein RecA